MDPRSKGVAGETTSDSIMEHLATLDHVKDKVEILKGSANHGSKVEYAAASRRVGYHVKFRRTNS